MGVFSSHLVLPSFMPAETLQALTHTHTWTCLAISLVDSGATTWVLDGRLGAAGASEGELGWPVQTLKVREGGEDVFHGG